MVDEAKELVQKAQAEKAERDRELNQLIKQQEEQKHLIAQVKQLIELNKQPKDADGVAYHFNDNNKVKTLYVSDSHARTNYSRPAGYCKTGRKL